MHHQLVTLGEAMLRLSVRPGDRIDDAPAFQVHVAGSEANVAYAAARVGLKSAWISALPDNPLGHRVAGELAAGGVDTSLVRWVPNGRLGLYFVELAAAPRSISVTYDRAGSAMARASVDDFDWRHLADTQFLHVSGITFGLSASCAEVAKRAMKEARQQGARVTFDVNYRQKLWSVEAAAAASRVAAGLADVVICTSEDARDLFGVLGTGGKAASHLRSELGVETVVLTLGTEGAVAVSKEGPVKRPGHRVDTVDRVGAGDAFTAGLVWGLVDGSLELGLERGLAMSALKMSLHGDLFRLDSGDVTALIAREGREVGR
ncbi:MAG TPA: sugar kinase [Candidatus Polarisedimenticolia bacterium]|nr:sugar kinase [Candidatus Polarisedimenticolia bacterium]